MKQIIRLVRCAFLSCLLLLPLLANSGPLKIVSTIKPIQMIVDEIAGPNVKSSLLLPQGASPHHFRLKPSDIRRMWQADLIFWVGPNFESFLNQQIQRISTDKSVVSLGRGLITLEGDAHIWLDPLLAVEIGQRIALSLIAIDSKNSVKYEENLENWLKKMNLLDNQLTLLFATAKSPAYILQHRSLDYFEDRYKLTHLAIINSGAEHQTSVKNLLVIDGLLASGQAKCVVLEPGFPQNLVTTLNISERSHIFTFDPLMHDTVDYVDAIRLLGDKLLKCS